MRIVLGFVMAFFLSVGVAKADVVSDMTGTISGAISSVGTSQQGILLTALGLSLAFLIYIIVRKSMAYAKKS